MVNEQNGVIGATFDNGGSIAAWDLAFAGPGMVPLSVGSYAGAQAAISPTAPSIALQCGAMEGSFVVLALERDATSQTLTVAAIDFQAQCLAAPSPPTKGKLRFHSALP